MFYYRYQLVFVIVCVMYILLHYFYPYVSWFLIKFLILLRRLLAVSYCSFLFFYLCVRDP